MRILLVEDDPDLRGVVAELLREPGHEVTPADDGSTALAIAGSRVFDLVISDIRLPRVDGLTVFREIKGQSPGTDIVLMTGHATIAAAVQAVKDGARDYVMKPLDPHRLVTLVARIANEREGRRQLADARAELGPMDTLPVIAGRSPQMVAALRRMETIAPSHAAVLITGETGTGKELMARALHDRSPLRKGPFIVVNCAALPQGLVESELFGHERGAFTGATHRRRGRFEAAGGGTIFFDEVAEMPLATQAKLLRVMQDGTFEPIGSNTTISVTVRVVSATHRNLKERIGQDLFREDLYYRLNVLDIALPALRERRGELPFLLHYFLRKFTPPEQEISTISSRAWDMLSTYAFPGNIRELSHAVQRAVVMAAGGEIDAHHLPSAMLGVVAQDRDMPGLERPLETLSEAMGQFDQECIERALHFTRGDRGEAAARLGISRRTLWEKMRLYGLAEKETVG